MRQRPDRDPVDARPCDDRRVFKRHAPGNLDLETPAQTGGVTHRDRFPHSVEAEVVQKNHVHAGDREHLRRAASEWHTAFPDSTFAVEEMIAEGQNVVVCATYSGTHTGEFQGIAATGRQVAGTWIGMFRVRDGKIVERWVEWDLLSFYQQLGVIPLLGGGGE